MFRKIFRAIDALVAACERLTALLNQCSDRLEEALPESVANGQPAEPEPKGRKAAR